MISYLQYGNNHFSWNHSFCGDTKRISGNTLATLTLMIAESRTEEKNTMVKVIVNLINKNN